MSFYAIPSGLVDPFFLDLAGLGGGGDEVRTLVIVPADQASPYTMASTDDVEFAGNSLTAKLPASPTKGEWHRFFWKSGTGAPTIDGNGKNVRAFPTPTNGSTAGTTTMASVGDSGTVEYDGAEWAWWG